MAQLTGLPKACTVCAGTSGLQCSLCLLLPYVQLLCVSSLPLAGWSWFHVGSSAPTILVQNLAFAFQLLVLPFSCWCCLSAAGVAFQLLVLPFSCWCCLSSSAFHTLPYNHVIVIRLLSVDASRY